MTTRPRPAAPLPAPTPASVTYLVPLTQWHTRHAWPPAGGLRWLVFHAATNGFKSAFKRVGRRILIDEAEFFRCVERANATAPKPPSRRSLTLPKPVEVLDPQEAA